MSKNEKIYYENFKDAVERNRKQIPAVHKKLKNAGFRPFGAGYRLSAKAVGAGTRHETFRHGRQPAVHLPGSRAQESAIAASLILLEKQYRKVIFTLIFWQIKVNKPK